MEWLSIGDYKLPSLFSHLSLSPSNLREQCITRVVLHWKAEQGKLNAAISKFVSNFRK